MATIGQAGSANELIIYTGTYVSYIKKSNVGYIKKGNSTRICIQAAGFYTELEFDDETQRDNALTTLLTYF